MGRPTPRQPGANASPRPRNARPVTVSPPLGPGPALTSDRHRPVTALPSRRSPSRGPPFPPTPHPYPHPHSLPHPTRPLQSHDYQSLIPTLIPIIFDDIL